MSEPYSKREIDLLLNPISEKLDKIDDRMSNGFKGVHARQDYANGKTNKIIIALMLAFGMILGLGATNFTSVIKILF